ncbi:3385_t:CDS:1, partial [Cetraspora pellucida]
TLVKLQPKNTELKDTINVEDNSNLKDTINSENITNAKDFEIVI